MQIKEHLKAIEEAEQLEETEKRKNQNLKDLINKQKVAIKTQYNIICYLNEQLSAFIEGRKKNMVGDKSSVRTYAAPSPSQMIHLSDKKSNEVDLSDAE